MSTGPTNIMLCIICDKEFSAGQKAAELYSHAEDEHGLSKEDYDKVANYVLEGGDVEEWDIPGDDERSGGKEQDMTRPKMSTKTATVDVPAAPVEQPPILLCIVCEAEFRKGDEKRFWAHVGGEHGLTSEEYEKMDNLMEDGDGGVEEEVQGRSEKGEQGSGEVMMAQIDAEILNSAKSEEELSLGFSPEKIPLVMEVEDGQDPMGVSILRPPRGKKHEVASLILGKKETNLNTMSISVADEQLLHRHRGTSREDEEYANRELSDSCEYVCPLRFDKLCRVLCRQRFYSADFLFMHVKGDHKVSADFMQTFVRRPEEYLTKKATHSCVLCGAELLKDRKVLRLHIARHGLKNLGEYKKQVIGHRQRNRVGHLSPHPSPRPLPSPDPSPHRSLLKKPITLSPRVEAGSSGSTVTDSPSPITPPPHLEPKITPHPPCGVERPRLSFGLMIAEALMQAEDRMLPLCEIYTYINQKYPYFRMGNKSWQNAIRHNLTTNPSFHLTTNPSFQTVPNSMERARTEGRGKFWTMEDGAERRFKKTNRKMARCEPEGSGGGILSEGQFYGQSAPLEEELHPRINHDVGPTLTKLFRKDRPITTTPVDVKEVFITYESNKENEVDRGMGGKQAQLSMSKLTSSASVPLADDSSLCYRCKLCSLRSRFISEMKEHLSSHHRSTHISKFITLDDKSHPDDDGAYDEDRGSEMPSESWEAPRITSAKKSKALPIGVLLPSAKRIKTIPRSVATKSTSSEIFNNPERRDSSQMLRDENSRKSAVEKPSRLQSEDASSAGTSSSATNGKLDTEEANATTPSDPSPAPPPTPRHIDPRMLQFKELCVLMEKGKGGGDVFRCEICGRVLVNGTLADANRHCVVEHSINVVQYYKMASGKCTGGSWMDACLFKCQICWDFETTAGKEFAEHISSRHQMSGAVYEETFESLVFAPSHVECPRCGGTVLHCEKDISEHQDRICPLKSALIADVDDSKASILTLLRRRWGLE